jgi:hypothetical protein
MSGLGIFAGSSNKHNLTLRITAHCRREVELFRSRCAATISSAVTSQNLDILGDVPLPPAAGQAPRSENSWWALK